MSAPPVYASPPMWPPSGYNPYSLDPAQILAAMQNNGLTTNIYDSTIKTTEAVNDSQRALTAEISGVNKSIYDATLQNGMAIERTSANGMATTERVNAQLATALERASAMGMATTERANGQLATAVERTSANGMAATDRANAQLATALERASALGLSTTERVNGQLASAIERTGANSMSTTERVNSQLATAVERNGANNGSAIERNAGNIMTSIERIAGEGRLTTTVTDAATRQANNDSARDILRAIDRVGNDATGTTKEGFSSVLSAVERNSGENRVQTLVSAGQTDAKLTDVRYSIINDVNRSAADIMSQGVQNFNVINKAVTDAAWEGRTATANGFQNISESQLHTKHNLAQQAAQNYSSLLMETQKLAHNSDKQSADHYASSMLESQKLAHYTDKQADNHFAAMISKSDSNFATLLLEQQKTKECLAQQAAQQFAISQLEAQKVKEVITMQLQEAKYEALKSKNELSKEMAECCCEVKQKIDQRTQDVIGTVDTLDRNRLRDEINTTNNENNLLKFAEFASWPYEGRGSRRRHHHHHRR